MTTITQKGKKSIWVWVFLATIAIIAVVLAVLHYTGKINLAFLGVGYMNFQMWSSATLINALLVDVGFLALGAVGMWIAIKYFIGQKVTTPVATYTPQGQAISSPAQTGNETVIS